MIDTELNKYAVLAHNILNAETQYQSNKSIISELFKDKSSSDFESVVKNRITVIDSYYSTQMNKRLYGIDELALTISQYPDDVLKLEIEKFLTNPQEKSSLYALFSKEYGIDKSGKPFGKATSLISKYLYFLNQYQFPIYDSLAFVSLKLFKNNGLFADNYVVNEENYFTTIKEVNRISGINNYEKLDNLLWLIGKLHKGSFAILMDMNKYLKLIDSKEIKAQLAHSINKKSHKKDEIIRSYIKENYITSPIFSDDQKSFFEFVFSLE